MKGSGKKISTRDLSSETFFELTLPTNMTHEVYREIKDRIEQVWELLDGGEIERAKAVIDSLLRSPLKRRGRG